MHEMIKCCFKILVPIELGDFFVPSRVEKKQMQSYYLVFNFFITGRSRLLITKPVDGSSNFDVHPK